MEKRILIIIVLSLLISGCVSPPPPAATPAPAATSMATATPAAAPGTDVMVLQAPETVEAGRSFEISWRVNSPVKKNITHTAVHYGPEKKSEPLTLQSYPNLTNPQGGIIPANFTTGLIINNTGIIYFRAHAIIDGAHYWSPEKTVTVSASPTVTPSIPPTIRVISYPVDVNGDTNFTIQWEITGGTPGYISFTAIHWGFKSGGANTSDYPRASRVQTGKTPGMFSVDMRAPAGGTIYLRAHAIVDGVDIYSNEYQITIIAPMGGGGAY